MNYNAMWRITKGRRPFPVAIVQHGSVIQRVVWGLTRAHAVRRGQRWINRQEKR